jgi:hypothetical protein
MNVDSDAHRLSVMYHSVIICAVAKLCVINRAK